jgi:chromosome segregation ATPase
VAEPTARDRQRLEALQERLAASKEEKRAWTEERKELLARATAGERAARQLEQVEEKLAAFRAELEAERAARSGHEQSLADYEQQLGTAGRQSDDLVVENRQQAEQLEALRGENENLRQAADEASSERAAVAARADLERQVQALEAENATNAEALRTARAQLESGNRPQVLPAEEVGSLVQSLVGQIRGSLPGLDVSDGEVRLKVAFAAAGDSKGFVVPSADATEAMTGPLHEVAFRFERSRTS